MRRWAFESSLSICFLVLFLVSGISVFGAPIGGEVLPKSLASPTWLGQTSPFWYGVFAVLMSVGMGWIAGRLFALV